MKFERLIAVPLKHAKTTVCAILVLVAVCAIPLRRLEMDNNLDVWFSHDNPVYSRYLKRNDLFGTDYSLVLAYKNKDLFTKNGIEQNIKLLHALNELPSVKHATGLTSVPIITAGGLILPPLSKSKFSSDDQLRRVKTFFVTNELYRHQVISADGQKTAILVLPLNEDIQTYRTLVSQVQNLLEREDFAALDKRISGALYILIEYDKFSSQETAVFMSMCIAVILFLCLLYFKAVKIAIIPFLTVIASMVMTYCLFVITHNVLSMVSSIMPIIIMIGGTTVNVHILQNLHGVEDKNPDRLVQALQRVLKPCFLASMTTAVALLAFSFSSIGALRVFGIFTATGIVITYLLSISLSPALYVLLSKGVPSRFGWDWHPARVIGFVFAHRTKFLVLSSLLTIFAVLGMIQLTPETDQMRQLKKSHPLRQDADTLNTWFSGTYPLDFIVHSRDGNSLQIKELNAFFQHLEEKAMHFEKVEKVISPLTIDRLANELSASLGPGIRNAITSAVSAEHADAIFSVFADSMHYARMHIWSQWMTNQDMTSLADSLLSWANSADAGKAFDFYVTGSSFIYTELNRVIFKNQLTSVAFCFVIIFVIFVLFTRSIVLAILAMIPNIMPVCITLGLMGWFSVPLDVVTVVIAAITLGLSVDDTIHFIHGCCQDFSYDSMQKAIKRTGAAIISTSVFISAGFIILVLSRFMPLVYFGVFVSLNAVFALLFDLTVLPVLLNSRYTTQKKHVSKYPE